MLKVRKYNSQLLVFVISEPAFKYPHFYKVPYCFWLWKYSRKKINENKYLLRKVSKRSQLKYCNSLLYNHNNLLDPECSLFCPPCVVSTATPATATPTTAATWRRSTAPAWRSRTPACRSRSRFEGLYWNDRRWPRGVPTRTTKTSLCCPISYECTILFCSFFVKWQGWIFFKWAKSITLPLCPVPASA